MLRDILFPGFSTRSTVSEWMDADSVSTARLEPTLRDLRRVNDLLGGYNASSRALAPVMKQRSHLRILDVGTGGADHLVYLVKKGHHLGCHTEATGIDVSPNTIRLAQAHVDNALPDALRSRITLKVGDALNLPYRPDAFDVSHAALILHHFHGSKPVRLLREMNRVSQYGIVINDLHRHPLAYAGIWLLSRLLQFTPMVQNDAPLSVRRGFLKSEMRTLAKKANLSPPTIHWHWAFRWTLSTVSLPT